MRAAAILAAWVVLVFLAACSTAPRFRVTMKDGTRVEHRGEADAPATITQAADGTVTITAPKTYAPPAPETSADKARTRAQIAYRIVFVLGIAAAAFGLSKGWEILGIGGACAALGAFCGIGLATVSTSVITAVIVGGVCISITGAACWFFKVRKPSGA
jgi:hypothetical protein